jgi:hypothetical protein
MFCQTGCDQWLMSIRTHLPHLSKPQAIVLALWSFGMGLARSCALTAVSTLLAAGLQRKDYTVRQQWRAWCSEVTATQGVQRWARQVETCCAPLLAWVLSEWQGTQLAVALDATTLGTRFVVVALSVVSRGCAIPVAWAILPAGAKQAWRGTWLRLRRRRRPAVPKGWTVLVLAARGVYAPWLLQRMVRLGWPPFLRLNTGGPFRPAGTPCFRPLATCAPRGGPCWQGRGTACKSRGSQLEWTLWARWEAD